MTFLFDPTTAWDTLRKLEKGWGGTPSERMAAEFDAFAAKYGTSAPKVGSDEAVQAAIETARAPVADSPNQDVITPRETPREADSSARTPEASAEGGPTPSTPDKVP